MWCMLKKIRDLDLEWVHTHTNLPKTSASTSPDSSAMASTVQWIPKLGVGRVAVKSKVRNVRKITVDYFSLYHNILPSCSHATAWWTARDWDRYTIFRSTRECSTHVGWGGVENGNMTSLRFPLRLVVARRLWLKIKNSSFRSSWFIQSDIVLFLIWLLGDCGLR